MNAHNDRIKTMTQTQTRKELIQTMWNSTCATMKHWNNAGPDYMFYSPTPPANWGEFMSDNQIVAWLEKSAR